MNLEEKKREYFGTPLSFEELDPNPLQQFAKWYEAALQAEPLEPNAVALATSNLRGESRVRYVLLKGIDERGFLFFTNYSSIKGKHLEENPKASFACYWPTLYRQVCVSGRCEKSSPETSFYYFQSRPFLSRVAAYTSPQSQPVPKERAYLENLFNQNRLLFESGDVPMPENWGGYWLIPDTIEFWQGRENRFHDRFVYFKEAGGQWKIERLAP
ncbi:pyridoxamine 5'-phosphate oxidase [Candidatus Methylacidiphilum infernorum]|uniref:Pyridoxamine 5'-phosphate oxidase n=1 Tax=Methylacidiphilum infernorum (isolate V4) TaxID=481448 RepID=B3DV52_METI4|nr:pyridoxamine 5'-phosphate oxidase [Candidatus Methylacidiphilum infernorum]ACD83205.1 Pyridoxamine-phosphate oxidase [Methylacidiphilum infernorum V4]